MISPTGSIAGAGMAALLCYYIYVGGDRVSSIVLDKQTIERTEVSVECCVLLFAKIIIIIINK